MFTYTFSGLENLGRLGNQLWQVGATVGTAKQRGGGARIKPTWLYRPFFSVPEGLYGPPIDGSSIFDLTARHHELDTVEPFYQELRYIAGAEAELRRWFQPSPAAAAETQRRYPHYWKVARDPDPVVKPRVAMHVRRGDYVNNPDHFPLCTADYYQAAVEQMPADATFLIFSDDIAWCERNWGYLGLQQRSIEFVNGVPRDWERRFDGIPEDQYDLFLMMRCQHHIIANSSFSWWGAFLSDDPSPIYPSAWFGPRISWHERALDCIPDTWTMVKC